MNHNIQECHVCNRYFHNPEGYYRCWICTKKNKEWKLYRSDEILDATMTQFDKAYREQRDTIFELLELRTQIDELKKEIDKSQRPKNVLQLDTIAKKRIKQLLRLCHPDKHGGSNETAEEITQWLLKLKRT